MTDALLPLMESFPLPFQADSLDDAPVGSAAHCHLIVAAAAWDAQGHRDYERAVQALKLPHLQQLLRTLRHLGAVEHTSAGVIEQSTPAHERAAAWAWALDADAPAWAAWTAPHWWQELAVEPAAWFTPCHWSVGADQIHMTDPRALQLSMDDARALHAVLAPWFEGDGLQLRLSDAAGPLRWLITGEPLAHLQTTSLERVLRRDVRHWLTREQPRQKPRNDPSGVVAASQTNKRIERLQSEVQMLLYTHPLNEQRQARGMPPVNAFWLHGAGVVEPSHAQTVRQNVHVHCVDAMRQAALIGHWQAWAEAWQRMDEAVFAQWAQQLPAHVAAGRALSVHLCSECQVRTWSVGAHTKPVPWWQRWWSARASAPQWPDIVRGL